MSSEVQQRQRSRMSPELKDKHTSQQQILLFLSKYSIFFSLIVIWLILAILTQGLFTTSGNISNLLVATTAVLIVATGMTFIIISGGIDLSVGSVAGLVGMVTGAAVTTPGVNPYVGMGIGLLVGVLAGAINGTLIAYGRITPLIATLGMLGIARGLALAITGGEPIANLPRELNFLGIGRTLGIPNPLYVVAIVIIVGYFILNYTQLGRYSYAIGGNEEAARLSGIPVRRHKLTLYILSGFLSGVAGLVLVGLNLSASPTNGDLLELNAIAAVVIGGTSLQGGAGGVLGTIVGAILMGSLTNGQILLGVQSYYSRIIAGVVIIVAVLLDRLRQDSG
jgi:ribose/xylose/arabinose/galactoside ABC-type transport system permease subunit